MKDFENIVEVMAYRKEALVVDLLDFAIKLDDDELQDSLIPAPEGIYTPGSTKPMFLADRVYYIGEPYLNNVVIGANLLKIPNSEITGDIYQADGRGRKVDVKLVIKASAFLKAKKYMTDHPTIPVPEINLAAAVAVGYIDTICPHSGITASGLHINDCIKREGTMLMERGVPEACFSEMLDKIMTFVGDDTWNLYAANVQNTNLIVSKGVDWRIYCYYRDRFEKQERALLDDRLLGSFRGSLAANG